MNILHQIHSLKNSKLAINSILLFAGNMAVNVFAYLYHLIVGRILGPVGYGELAALLSLLYIVSVPSEVLRTVSMKFFSQMYAKQQLGQAKALYMSFIKYIAVIGVMGFFVCMPFVGSLKQFLNISNDTYFLWLYLLFAFQLLSGLSAGVLLAFQKFVMSTLTANIMIVTRLVFGVVSAPFGVGASLAATAIAAIVGMSSYIFPFKKLFRDPAQTAQFTAKDIIKYSMPTLFSLLGLTALYSMDIILVKHYFSPVDAGIYSSLAILGKVIFFASSSIGFVLFPVMAHKWELGKPIHREFFSSVVAVGALSFGIAGVYFIFPELVVNLLFGAKFMAAAKYVGIFGVFLAFFSVASILMNAYLAIGKTRVSIFMIAASIAQIIGISYLHANLAQVIYINISVVAILSVSLMLYYPYVKNRIS